MNRMSVGKRLTVAFAALIAFVIGVGWIGLDRMRALNDSLSRVADENWVKAELAQRALLGANDTSLRLNHAFFQVDRAAVESDFTQIEQNRRKIDEAVAQIAALSKADAGEESFSRARDSWTAYATAAQNAKDLLDKDRLSDAQRALTDEVVPRLATLLDAFSAYAIDQGKKIDLARRQGHERYGVDRALVIALVAFATIAAIFVAFLVTRSVTEPVQRIVSVVEQIARGDLRVAAKVDRSDELGRLQAAVKQMTDKLGLPRGEFYKQRVARIPLKRGGTVDEIAAMAAFLCSSEADYITGQAYNVDGGSEMN